MSNDTNGLPDLFVRDLMTGRTTPVALNPNGTPVGGDRFLDVSISADGRYVMFNSFTKLLVPSDTNSFCDIYMCDVLTGSNVLVSMSLDAQSGGNRNSEKPMT